MSSLTALGTTLMPRKLPPFVECWRDRHQKLRVYFRKAKGSRIALPSQIGSAEFNEAYAAALAGQHAPRRERGRTIQPGTLAALIASYKRSEEYTKQRPTTQKGYSSRLEILSNQHGHRS